MTNKYDTLVKYAPPEAHNPSTETLTEAHFEVLNELFDWWQVKSHTVPQENKIYGYQLNVLFKVDSTLSHTTTIWAIDIVTCVKLAIEWKDKFR